MAKTQKQDIKKIVLAYSGGLDTSIILKWLKNEYGCKVVAFSADLGQGDELDPIRAKALATGADKVYIDDLKEEFVRDFVFPMFRANAIYEGHYLLGTSIARPLIAKRQMEIAAKEKCDAVSHGATGKGNDQVRFELAYYHFDPSIKVVAPWREWTLNSRQALIEYAKKNGIPIPVTKKRPWSSDRNLLHISFEGGILEDTWAEAPEEMYVLTTSPEKAPNKPQYVEIEFTAGPPDGRRAGMADHRGRQQFLDAPLVRLGRIRFATRRHLAQGGTIRCPSGADLPADSSGQFAVSAWRCPQFRRRYWWCPAWRADSTRPRKNSACGIFADSRPAAKPACGLMHGLAFTSRMNG